MIAPTTPPAQAPASVTPTGEPGARRRLGKSGAARKGRTVAKRKPEKTRPAPAKKAAARAKNTRAGKASSFREKEGWRTEPKVGGRKPSAKQKKGPTKKPGKAQKTLAKRATGKTATRAPAAKRAAPAAKRAAPAAKRAAPAMKRTARRTTGRG
jgi:hypothetical protein